MSSPDTSAITSSDTGLAPYEYSIPNLNGCDDLLETEHGFLCALRPSRLDAEARDTFGEDSIVDRTLGFGYHVVAFPRLETEINGVYVHFTGSMGRAYNQSNGGFPSATLLDESMQAGLITLQIAYHNRYAVNSPEECIGSNDVDNCAGDVRREKITGENLTNVVDVPISDSINHRLELLVTHLNQQGFTFPVSVFKDASPNWSELLIGGHSQGSGHALYITKFWGSQHTCLFGGPFDVADTVPQTPPEAIADWYLVEPTVDISTVRALLSEDDSSYVNFVRAYDILNMEEDIHWQSFQSNDYTNGNGESISGHGAVVHDPRFAALRHEMCFSHGQ